MGLKSQKRKSRKKKKREKRSKSWGGRKSITNSRGGGTQGESRNDPTCKNRKIGRIGYLGWGENGGWKSKKKRWREKLGRKILKYETFCNRQSMSPIVVREPGWETSNEIKVRKIGIATMGEKK